MTLNYYDRNRQKEIMESLSREKLLTENRLYKSEELPAYQSFAEAVLRNISAPGKDSVPPDIHNLAACLRGQAEGLGLRDDPDVRYAAGQAERLAKKIYGLKKGLEGEALAKRAMFGINAPNQILMNLEFTMDDLFFETDAVVINTKGICIVEVKNIHRNLVIDENGTLVTTDGSNRAYCNVRTQLNNAAAVVRRVLEQSFADHPKLMALAGHIQKVLFSADSIIIDSRREIIVADRNNIVRILNDLPGEETLSREEIEMVAKALKNAAQPNRNPINYDYVRVARAFAAAVAKLEYAAEHDPVVKFWKSCGGNGADCTEDSGEEAFDEEENFDPFVSEKKRRRGQIAAAVAGIASLGVGLMLIGTLRSL